MVTVAPNVVEVGVKAEIVGTSGVGSLVLLNVENSAIRINPIGKVKI
jgi:hypothetical protein